MAEALTAASRVFIIGYSFPSTDHHLRTLFYQVRYRRERENKPKRYDEVFCCMLADGGQEEVFASADRFLPAERFHRHDQGFEDFVYKLIW